MLEKMEILQNRNWFNNKNIKSETFLKLAEETKRNITVHALHLLLH